VSHSDVGKHRAQAAAPGGGGDKHTAFPRGALEREAAHSSPAERSAVDGEGGRVFSGRRPGMHGHMGSEAGYEWSAGEEGLGRSEGRNGGGGRMLYRRETLNLPDFGHGSQHEAELWQDLAGCLTAEDCLDRVVKLYGMPGDKVQTRAQLRALLGDGPQPRGWLEKLRWMVSRGVRREAERRFLLERVVQVVKGRKQALHACRMQRGVHATLVHIPDAQGGLVCGCAQAAVPLNGVECPPPAADTSLETWHANEEQPVVEREHAAATEAALAASGLRDIQMRTCVARYGAHGEWRSQGFGGQCACREGAELVEGRCIAGGAPREGHDFGGRNRDVSNATTEQATGVGSSLSAAEALSALRAADSECREAAGKRVESDGQGGCKCLPGFTSDITGGESCEKGSNKACAATFGAQVEFDGNSHCRCAKGFVLADGSCVPASAAACRDTPAGNHSRFDGGFSCVCERGYVPDASGECRSASSALCAEMHGPLAEFDGHSQCVCMRGAMATADEDDVVRCEVGGDAACAKSLGPHAAFNIQTGSCECKAGFAQAAGTCVEISGAVGAELCVHLLGPRAVVDPLVISPDLSPPLCKSPAPVPLPAATGQIFGGAERAVLCRRVADARQDTW